MITKDSTSKDFGVTLSVITDQNSERLNKAAPKKSNMTLDMRLKNTDILLEKRKTERHQYERMERWIFQLADKMDVKLKYEA